MVAVLVLVNPTFCQLMACRYFKQAIAAELVFVRFEAYAPYQCINSNEIFQSGCISTILVIFTIFISLSRFQMKEGKR